LKEGDIVGSYRIQKVLGRGAMGVVLLVIDEMLDRKAALKFIGFELAGNTNCRDRFVREGRMLAKLSPHPNLVSVYSGGEWMGTPYFTMAYIKGLAFNEMLKIKSPIPFETAIKAARDTASALDFVWNEANLVHRDIKPANLMYENEKEITVVTDFGLAKPDKQQFDSTLTTEGAILGTPDYISPEQIRCEQNLDWRSDLYSLGCTLFHLLTGKAPFKGTSIGDLIAAHLKEPVPDLKDHIAQIERPVNNPELSVNSLECSVNSLKNSINNTVDNGGSNNKSFNQKINILSPLLKQMLAKDKANRPSSYKDVIEQLNSII
jgi:serine/threonine-protein kinase